MSEEETSTTKKRKRTTTQPKSKQLHVYASEWAGFIGKHPFQHKFEVALQVMARAKWTQYTSSNQYQQRALETALQMNSQQYAEQQPVIDTQALTTKIQEAITAQTISAADGQALLAQREQVVQKLQGQASEHQFVTQNRIVDNNARTQTLVVSPGLLVLSGRSDGFDPSTKTMIEIKRRKAPVRMKKAIPVYDRIQCHCYMKLFDQASIVLYELGPPEQILRQAGEKSENVDNNKEANEPQPQPQEQEHDEFMKWVGTKRRTRLHHSEEVWLNTLQRPAERFARLLISCFYEQDEALELFKHHVMEKNWQTCQVMLHNGGTIPAGLLNDTLPPPLQETEEAGEGNEATIVTQNP